MSEIEDKEKFIELRAKGMSFARISDAIKISKPTLIKWSQELEIEIQNMRAIEQEALREKYLITKEKRLEMLGVSLDKIKEEIATRDLSEISTEKLFHLNIKLLQEIKGEEASSLVFARDASLMEMTISERKEWQA
ncbi:MAG: hypothetical protein UV19_C0017G0004 [Parcubacteria group bacterium GW2011_GWA2_42_28]|nr:MAG: hypothetical protein UV19_C0017G0004 [Parcubacteria group bacterium GW2011_GWA2_42_28]